MPVIVGPFSQIITMEDLPFKGPLSDAQLRVIENGALLIEEGKILRIGRIEEFSNQDGSRFEIDIPAVCIPGFIDCHTHMCFSGSRSHEYALKLQGVSYQEIAKNGGGIYSTVIPTRKAPFETLLDDLITRADQHLARGITTCEVKSGYGLTIESEKKLLEVIKEANHLHPISFIPTCLAAHIKPKESISNREYLRAIQEMLFPILQQELLTNRVDIFVEKGAFSPEEAKEYLLHAQSIGLSCVIHGDQFSSGGARLAAEIGAVSVDHLEHIQEQDSIYLAQSDVVAVALPGASIGLGEPFAPVRSLLDRDLSVAIASDWNPGSAPMGDLLTQSAILGMYQKLTLAETFAAITYRAARALEIYDRGILKEGMVADFIVFPTKDYRDILYFQGSMKPVYVFKQGTLVYESSHNKIRVSCG